MRSLVHQSYPYSPAKDVVASMALFLFGLVAPAGAADWPMWRCDSARSGESSQALSDELHLLWTRQLPKHKPTYREPRLQFDAGYEPIVLGKTMFVASSNDDSVTAYDTETGERKWKCFAEGPVRLAPAAWNARVFFGSDDGCLYCVTAGDGELLWKFQAVPSDRNVLGNGRLISVWPVRGGPVVHDGRVYFAAGVWPFEGVFIYCLDAESGAVIWRNDESSYLYGQYPHAAEALGGVTPQGYLVVNDGELAVPCGQAVPATYDLATGKLLAFKLPRPGRLPGGWFVSADVRRGEVVLDAVINSDLHEDKVYQGPGEANVRTTIRAGERLYDYGDGYRGVEGEIHSMLAADEKLFVVSLDGMVYAFGPQEPASVRRHETEPQPLPPQSGKSRGFLVVLGIDESAVAFVEKAQNEDELGYHVLGFDADARRIADLRLSNALGKGSNIAAALHVSAPEEVVLPPFLTHMVYVSDAKWLVATRGRQSHSALFDILRPYGGMAHVALSDEEHERLASDPALKGNLTIERKDGITFVRREGRLAGAANYTGGWISKEERVSAPLGLLWFDDTLSHFKRSPQPMFVDGVMMSYSKD